MTRPLFVLTLLASVAIAADRPNFTGTWNMNATKSTFGPVPAPDSFIRKITHAEPSLTIADDQKGGAGSQSGTHTYTTDGKEIAYEVNGANVKGAATWEGDALVIRSAVDAGGLAVTLIEKMTLGDGNKTLTDAVHIVTPQGDIDVSYAFDKQ